MSSIMSKQLGDFLQEQQEPFILEVYLLERGYSRRRFSSADSCVSGYSSSNVGTLLRRSISSGLKGNRTFIPNCSKFVRGLFSKLLAVADYNHKIINNSGTRKAAGFCATSEIGSGRSTKETGDEDKFSSASSATIFNSCSESDLEDSCYYSSRKDGSLATVLDYYQSSDYEHILSRNQVGVDEMFRYWKNVTGNKQLSPVSVLEASEMNDDASPSYKKKNDDDPRRSRHFQSSALLGANKTEKPFCRPDSSSSSQYSGNKKAVQQSRQLLFDCVEEVVERVKRSSRPDQPIPQILGPDKLWELICDDLSLLSQEPINETNTSRLVRFEVLVSSQEWCKFQQQKEEIGTQIADAILEDIRDEIIRDPL